MAIDPMDRVRKMGNAQRASLTGGKGPTSRQRSVDYGSVYRQGWQSLDEWNWTSLPLSKIYQMRSDPMLSFGLQFIKVPLVRAPWYIECSDARVAAFVDNALREIWHSYVFQYTNCFDFGYAPMIKNFALTKPSWTYIDPTDTKNPEKQVWEEGGIDAVVWKPFTGVAPEHAQPVWTPSGDFDGFLWSGGGAMAGVFPEDTSSRVSVDRAIWATNQKEKVFGSLYGESMLNPAYRYWWSYWFRMALADRAFERHVDPSMVVFFPPDPVLDDETGEPLDLRSTAINVFEQARSGSTIALPNSHVQDADGKSGEREWGFEQLRTDTNFSALSDSLAYLDVMKLRSLAVPEQALIEGSGGTSSRNVAAQMGDKLFESQYVRMLEIDEHCNRYLIPQLVALNFPEFRGSVRKVTRGFASTDIDLARQLMQLIGQSDPNSFDMVNIREIMSQYQIPLYTDTEVRANAARAAAEAAAQGIMQELGTDAVPQAEGIDIMDPMATAPDNATPKGGTPPPTQGVLAGPEEIRGVTDEYGRYIQPRETIYLGPRDFRNVVQRSYPGMEDATNIEKTVELQNVWEDVFRKSYSEVASLIEAGYVAGDAAKSEFKKQAKEAVDHTIVGGALASAAILLLLTNRSGASTSITLGFPPSELGDFAMGAQWVDSRVTEMSDLVSETMVDETSTFLASLDTQDPKEAAKAYRDHFRDFPTWKSQRVARGESTRAYRMGQILSAQEFGVETVRASDASNGTDFETDADCIQRHGQEYSIQEAMSETLTNTHPNCTLHWTPVPPNTVYAAEDEYTTWKTGIRRLFGRGDL